MDQAIKVASSMAPISKGVPIVTRLGFRLATALFVGSVSFSPVSAQTPRWPEQRANAWYAAQPWLVGSNYVPRSAINQLEMWQEATFNPAEIDRELGWAEALGMNTMRVFLHDLAWQQDPSGTRRRIDRFLGLAKKHKIRPIMVLFDSCWFPFPSVGIQPVPRKGMMRL